MNQPTSKVTIEPLISYSLADATAIGQLLPHLSHKFDGTPVDRQLLETIIASPYHEQLVARDQDSVIVGIATLSITIGVGAGRKVYLEDFVVGSEVQGSGAGSKLWEAILNWCRSHQAINLHFTSNPSRTAAQQFYLKRGAIKRDTECFVVDLS